MKLYITRSLIGIWLGLFCAAVLLGQETGKPDRWNGLTLNVSTPEDAIRLLGGPVKEKDNSTLDDLGARAWLSGKQREKAFKVFSYESVRDFEQVRLAFLDQRLVAIILDAPDAELKDDWIDPDDLPNLFGADFKPWYRHAGRKLPSPEEFRKKQPADLAKDEYNYWYDMIAVTQNAFIVSSVDNYKYISTGIFDRNADKKKKRREINTGGKYPGYVQQIQLISRKLAA